MFGVRRTVGTHQRQVLTVLRAVRSVYGERIECGRKPSMRSLSAGKDGADRRNLHPHPPCEFVGAQSRDQMAVMLLKHCNRRAHLPGEQMQIGATVHDLKCRVHVGVLPLNFVARRAVNGPGASNDALSGPLRGIVGAAAQKNHLVFVVQNFSENILTAKPIIDPIITTSIAAHT